MYDITKTRMLLTTAVFAAVAALFACGGANAAMGTQAVATAPAFPSGHELDTAIGTAMATQAVATAPAFPSGHELDTAIGTAMATQAARTRDRESGTLSGEQQAPQASGRTAANDAAHFPDTSDVVSRYLGNDRMGTARSRRLPRPSLEGEPHRGEEDGAAAAPSSRR